MSTHKLFEIGEQWIARIEGRPSLYHFWYDKRSGETRRRSFKTTDIEEAKRLLAIHAVSTKHNDPLDPEVVMLVVRSDGLIAFALITFELLPVSRTVA